MNANSMASQHDRLDMPIDDLPMSANFDLHFLAVFKEALA